MSDLRQEAADYAELQMDGGDGGDGGGLRPAHGAIGTRRLMPERAVFRLATQQRAARHLSAQEELEMDASLPCQPTPFISTSILLILAVPTWSA